MTLIQRKVFVVNKIDELINNFIKKWIPKYYPHLVDDDENDGEELRYSLKCLFDNAEGDATTEERKMTLGEVYAKVCVLKNEIENKLNKQSGRDFDFNRQVGIICGCNQVIDILGDMGKKEALDDSSNNKKSLCPWCPKTNGVHNQMCPNSKEKGVIK